MASKRGWVCFWEAYRASAGTWVVGLGRHVADGEPAVADEIGWSISRQLSFVMVRCNIVCLPVVSIMNGRVAARVLGLRRSTVLHGSTFSVTGAMWGLCSDMFKDIHILKPEARHAPSS